jgi:hypothetical protein
MILGQSYQLLVFAIYSMCKEFGTNGNCDYLSVLFIGMNIGLKGGDSASQWPLVEWAPRPTHINTKGK